MDLPPGQLFPKRFLIVCGIGGFVSLDRRPNAQAVLSAMDAMIAHRGPDGAGRWVSASGEVGLMHRRLAVIDLSHGAAQPMHGEGGTVIAYNGEIYNFIELRDRLASGWTFRTASDTEVILAAYDRWGPDCVGHLRGMFAFAIWDERRKGLFAARDRFGIKPFYYAEIDGTLYFASEAKALLPVLPSIETEPEALAEYLTFQYTIGDKTLFRHVHQLLPGHCMTFADRRIDMRRYWDVRYDVDFGQKQADCEERLRELLADSVSLHLRADIPVGAHVSGGIDSSLISILAAKSDHRSRPGFHGRFAGLSGYDESSYARIAAEGAGMTLHSVDITAKDFIDHIGDVIWHLDFPVAGPGSFPQYVVSELAAQHVKVVLGGQGGDEMFGGYARYLIAYFEQCIKAAIDGTYRSGNYVVTIESIVPNLGMLREYKPLIQEFWRDGLFDDLDARYFRLIDRSSDMTDEVEWGDLDKPRVFEAFRAIFNHQDNVHHEAYFDKMTHFDFKCLLPALLHVEDRMSMAHGVESRVPFLDHPLVEFMAGVPADVKFSGGDSKHLLKTAFRHELPRPILERRDKMGFPVPLKDWLNGELRDFVQDVFRSGVAQSRSFTKPASVLANFDRAGPYSRKIWGLLSLELWQQAFHDRAGEIRMTQPGSWR